MDFSHIGYFLNHMFQNVRFFLFYRLFQNHFSSVFFSKSVFPEIVVFLNRFFISDFFHNHVFSKSSVLSGSAKIGEKCACIYDCLSSLLRSVRCRCSFVDVIDLSFRAFCFDRGLFFGDAFFQHLCQWLRLALAFLFPHNHPTVRPSDRLAVRQSDHPTMVSHGQTSFPDACLSV